MKKALLISLLVTYVAALHGCKPKEPPTEQAEPEAEQVVSEPQPMLEPPRQASPEAEKAAVACANAWLALVDGGDYAASWDQAAGLFKGIVNQQDWAKSLETFRGALGEVVSRKLKSTRYTTTAPGAPDGKYVIVQYDTSFENKKSAVETVTPMLDSDGQWRVSGYYIK